MSIIVMWDPGSQIRPKIQQLTLNNLFLKEVVEIHNVTSLQKLTDGAQEFLYIHSNMSTIFENFLRDDDIKKKMEKNLFLRAVNSANLI